MVSWQEAQRVSWQEVQRVCAHRGQSRSRCSLVLGRDTGALSAGQWAGGFVSERPSAAQNRGVN